jgi:hypothetical protein
MRSNRLFLIAAVSALAIMPLASVYGEDADPIKTCMAAQPAQVEKKKHHDPVKLLFKGLASEMGTDMKDTMQDSIFVFSAKDVDPYKKKAPKDRPYTALEIQFVDGTTGRVIKYPDGSAKIDGAHFNGAVIAPNGVGTYIIAYPNGTRGKIVTIDNGYRIYRPDNTITTVKEELGGDYEIDNNKLGYIGTAHSDKYGMQYEFASKSF